MAYRPFGNAVAEWDDSDPLRFTLRREEGPRDGREIKTIKIDLTTLRAGYTHEFLTNLKEHLMERCQQKALISVKTEAITLKNLLGKTIALELFDAPVSVIDENFLLSLAREQENIPKHLLIALKASFSANPLAPLFAKGLVADDIPTREIKKGRHGSLIDRVLAKAFSRATASHILNVCDTA